MTQSRSGPPAAVPSPALPAGSVPRGLAAAWPDGQPPDHPSARPPPAPPAQPARAAPRRGGPRRRWATPRAVTALILREMATTYGRSPGGYLWAVFDPLAALAVLSVGFGLLLAHPPVGNSFPLFYATGYLPFMLFNDVANKMATSIGFSRGLLSYPAVTFIDALLARFILTLLTHLAVGALVLVGLVLVFEARAELDLPRVLSAYGLAALLGVGVGTLNCYLMTAFPLWERSWQIATRPLFLISGIFFLYGSLPRLVRDYLWYNPLVHVIGQNRSGFYSAYDGSYVSPAYVLGIALLTGFFGLLLLWRHYRGLLES